MKAEKLIGLYLAPHFFAISLLLAFIAARWGLASSCALSYEIAPMCSQSRIVLISSVCFIISSFMFLVSYALNFKGRPLIVQGFSRFFCVFLRNFSEKCTESIISCIFALSVIFRFSLLFTVQETCGIRKRLGKRLGIWLGNGKRRA